jgi:hypothetical protein
LKPSFNKSNQNCLSAPQRGALSGKSREQDIQTGRVMTTFATASHSSPADRRDSRSGPFAEIRAFWRQFFARAFDPYRPELHYMRGPGPACRAKQGARA